jgi:hypothetical protein
MVNYDSPAKNHTLEFYLYQVVRDNAYRNSRPL